MNVYFLQVVVARGCGRFSCLLRAWYRITWDGHCAIFHQLKSHTRILTLSKSFGISHP